MELTDIERRWVDLAQPRLGSRVVYATDDFFAAKDRMIDPAEPVFIPGKYDDNGKWMDGWESRRRRDGKHDHCIIRLGRPGFLRAVEIDTRHFTGNFPPAAALEWTHSDSEIPDDKDWRPLLACAKLQGNSRLVQGCETPTAVTHVRLHIYPDGGIARLRLFGEIAADITPDEKVDLAAMENGASAVTANNEHFGCVLNMLAPGIARDMGDGWETRRRREPGNDWAIIRLARPGRIEEIEIDTSHFKGNYPDSCFIQAAPDAGLPPDALVTQSMFWPIILPSQKLAADTRHRFTSQLLMPGPVRFLKLNIVPDGGIARLRVWGKAVILDS